MHAIGAPHPLRAFVYASFLIFAAGTGCNLPKDWKPEWASDQGEGSSASSSDESSLSGSESASAEETDKQTDSSEEGSTHHSLASGDGESTVLYTYQSGAPVKGGAIARNPAQVSAPGVATPQSTLGNSSGEAPESYQPVDDSSVSPLASNLASGPVLPVIPPSYPGASVVVPPQELKTFVSAEIKSINHEIEQQAPGTSLTQAEVTGVSDTGLFNSDDLAKLADWIGAE